MLARLPVCRPFFLCVCPYVSLVALVSYYWDITSCHGELGVTGEASLAGDVSAVTGLRHKVLAAYRRLVAAGGAPPGGPAGAASMIVPGDNVAAGVLAESRSMTDEGATIKVRTDGRATGSSRGLSGRAGGSIADA